MRSMTRALALLGGLLPAISGCQVATGPESATALGVIATASPSQILLGQPLLISIVIKNTSDHPIQIPGAAAAFLEVRDANHVQIAFGRFEIMPMVAHPPRTLAPGDTAIDHASWAGEVNPSEEAAKAGWYSIRAVVPVVGARGRTYAYSAPVDVELIAP